MKHNDLIIKIELTGKEEKIVDLEKIYPLGKIECDEIVEIAYKVDGDWITLNDNSSFNHKTARFIKLLSYKDCTFSIYVGLGYIASVDEEWTELFNRKGPWAGGDGIFSFNLTNGKDNFDLDEEVETLFVFGDTLIGKIYSNTSKRLYPISIPNNTIAYLKGNEPKEEKIEFHYNLDEFDTITHFYKPENDSQYNGTCPYHLCKYTKDKPLTPWLSGYSPKKVELIFDLYTDFTVDFIDFYNYFEDEQTLYGLESRGVKEFNLYGTNELENWNHLGQFTLEKANSLNDYNRIDINKNYRYYKMVITPIQGVGNHYSVDDTSEVVFGLNQVRFYSQNRLLTNVKVIGTSIMKQSKVEGWFWLQDGVVIGKYLYFLPLFIVNDFSRPEGLQFAVRGTSLVKTPIENGKLDFTKQTQKDTSLCVDKNNTQWLFGCAIMNHSKEAGVLNPDGYVYIYGYSTAYMTRKLHVARVKPEDFEHINKWEYYTENGWGTVLTESISLLEHISCEMSVSPIINGENKGKYLAIFQYDVNSKYIAYSIGETPVGPFTSPHKIYETPEPAIFGRTTYTYNAKAHPHLSSSYSVLVSYNTNTYSMDHNEANCDVYRPRFIRLKDTSGE